MSFEKAIERVLTHEGGYVNDPRDNGGETNLGITVAVARANGYAGSMRTMSRVQAKAIYRKQYWDAVKADQLPFVVAFQLFDAAVNHGVRRAVMLMQQSVGTTQDGVIGGKTIQAINTRNPQQLALLFNAVRLEFYAGLGDFAHFGKGWTRRVAANLRFAATD
jgi:lysozyme family protein